MPDRFDVVIIGAGIAGLSVTAALAAAGLEVLCLEARDRVGGRLLSSDSGCLDLGATWLWPGEQRAHQLATRLGIGVFAQRIDGDALYQDAAGVHRLRGNPIAMRAYLYATGAQNLAAALAATLPPGAIRLRTPVSAISDGHHDIQVSAAGVEVRATHVVLAVPPSLAATSIRFEPALPEQLARLALATPIWMGTVSKVVVQYPGAFWREVGLAGAAISVLGPLREIYDLSNPETGVAALFGFTPGAAADPNTREGSLTEQVLDQLVRLFGARAATPMQVVMQDWSREPYTATADVARCGDYGLFGHPRYARPAVDGRLHWASTETSAISPGHIEGALAAAERAAATVLAALSVAAAANTQK
jgi:monoamine oxidase